MGGHDLGHVLTARNAGIVTADCDDPAGGDPVSCGHVSGTATFDDPIEDHNGSLGNDVSTDTHDGGNSGVHFYARDADRQRSDDL